MSSLQLYVVAYARFDCTVKFKNLGYVKMNAASTSHDSYILNL